MQKISAVLLTSALTLLLTACGTAPAESANEDDIIETEEAAAQSNGEEEIQLEFWTLNDNSDGLTEAWDKAIADYESAHPGVTVNRTQYEGEAYKIKLKSAVAANELPDLFFSWAGGFSQPFVEAGKILPLDEAYEAYSDGINRGALDSASYDGVLYGTAYSSQAGLLYYNKAMFEQYNVKEPETVDELLDVCQTFIDNGVTPFAISAKDTWGPAVFFDNLALKYVGKENVVNTITRNGGSFKEEEGFLEAAELFSQLVDMGAFLESALSLNTDEAYQYFIDGTCPMWLMIDSLGNMVVNSTEDPENYGILRFPTAGENAEISDIMGGAGEIYCVSASTEYKEEASNAVFEIIKGVAKYASETGEIISIWNGDSVPEDSAEYLKLDQEYKMEATSSMLWWDTTMVSEDAQEYLQLLQELYVGNFTPEEFIDALNEQFTE